MPTKSKAQVADEKIVLIIQESAKIASTAGIDYPFSEYEAIAAYRALNALAEKIKARVPARGGKAKAEKQEGEE